MIRLLFIDDDPQAQKTLKMVLDGYHVISSYTGKQGLKLIREEDPDVVLLDINLPDEDGIKVLEKIADIPGPPPVIMLTAYSEIQLVVRAVKAGAYDYIVKPYEIKHLEGTIRQALQNQIPRSPGILRPGHCLDRITGESAAIGRVKELILRFGPSGAPILITGESGTGKELAARAIHEISNRSGAFVPLNCGAIPETLVESELFGSVRGAYTDAVTREGAFELANDGSLFLDEIGEISSHIQAKFLRVLEEKEICRLGSLDTVPLNVRVIAATNRNLKEEIRSDSFREDLYYRLGVLRIETPPLRERLDDLGILAALFLQEKKKKISSEALEKLSGHHWPGNVRELRNVMERAVLISDRELIQPCDVIFA